MASNTINQNLGGKRGSVNDTSILPNSVEAERAVLGAVLVDPEAFLRVIEVIDKSEFFYKSAHQEIFNALLHLTERSENIDLVTISQVLKDKTKLEEIGGVEYLDSLTEQAPIAANAPYYAKIVKSKSLLRNMILAGNEIVELGHNTEEDLDHLVDKAERIIFNLSQSKSKEQLTHIGDLVHQSWKILEEREANKGQLSGVNTGFNDLNAMTSGFQKSDLMILAARPAMGKCLHKDSELVLEDGSIKTIEEIYHSACAKLLTLDTNWKFSSTEPSNFVDDGIKPIFQVKTKSGRSLKTTLSHPYLTINGWKKLEELKPGDKIASPRKINIFGKTKMPKSKLKLLGYLIGDGCLTRSSIQFTNINPSIQKDFIEAVNCFDPSLQIKKSNSANRADSFRVSKSQEFIIEQSYIYEEVKKLVNSSSLGFKKTSKNDTSSLHNWLTELNLAGKNSYTKTIPSVLFTLRKEDIALFLNRLFATDGWATVLSSKQAQLGYASVSKRLVDQVQHLLLRFGILSSMRYKTVLYKGLERGSWQLNITEQNSIKTFIEEIGIYGKEEAINQVKNTLANKKYHTNTDLIPVEAWTLIEEAKGKESWVSLAKRAGFKSTSNIHPHKRALLRHRFLALAEALEDKQLINLANSDIYWDTIASIDHLGSEQVYDLTIPETHNFVANDICVHNTSLALNLAENVALQAKKPVAIFSLEMSKEQLVQRLLCARAEVDSSRVRSGQLHADDWEKLGEAMAELGEAPIYIDDSAGATVMELRGKCRRLQAQCGGELGLVVIDYLQLIEGRGNDNRISQISEISRGLKLIAREINVPVLALSQLSRAVESRQDKRPMLSDLRESGCLTADTLIYNPDTGNHVPLIQLVGTSGFNVLALDENKKLVKKKAKRAFYSGKKKVYKITTCSGNTIKASANHPFLKEEGWTALEDLKVNDYIASSRVLHSDAELRIDDQELIIMAHMIGDGCFVENQPYHYTSKDPNCLDIVSRMSTSLYNIQCNLVQDRNSEGTKSLYMPSPYHLTHNVKHPFTYTLEKHGLKKARSSQKILPSVLFGLGLDQVALFLSHLWATDGCICVSHNETKNSSKFNVSYSSQSLAMIKQIKKLLLKFGIQSRIGTNKKAGYKDQYQLNISDVKNIKLFAEKVGFFANKQDKYLELKDAINSVITNPNADVIPKSVWDKVRDKLKEKSISQRDFQNQLGTKYCGTTLYKSNISRKRLDKVAEILNDQELKNLAASDIFWDKIKSIEFIDEQDVYDIEVPDLHNFVAENFIVHNSIEQDADIVMFIYRDDYYNEESEKAGIADIIISKQRSGPTGDIQLLFQNNITKFKNPIQQF